MGKPGAISITLPGCMVGSAPHVGWEGAQHHLLLDIRRRGTVGGGPEALSSPEGLWRILLSPGPRQLLGGELTQLSEPLTSWGDKRVKQH